MNKSFQLAAFIQLETISKRLFFLYAHYLASKQPLALKNLAFIHSLSILSSKKR